TTYLSSGAVPGAAPDMSNARSLVGMLGPPSPPGFASGDAINSISFGRDGTLPMPSCGINPCVPVSGTLCFSVSRTSQGVADTDVNVNATFVVSEAAADLYIAAVGPFGRYADMNSPAAPVNDNLLAVDNTLLGLRPRITDNQEDNVT